MSLLQSRNPVSTARKILATHGASTKVVLLGTHGMGFELLGLPPDARGCDVIAVVDDNRTKTEAWYWGSPLITSERFVKLCRQHPDLLAINTCERSKPKNYFDGLCDSNDIAHLDYASLERLLRLRDPDRGTIHVQPRHKTRNKWHYRLNDAGDWLIANAPLPGVKRGVAVVRTDNVGDFFVWLNAASRLRHHYAGQKITLFASELTSSYARTLPYWDEVVEIPREKFNSSVWQRWKSMLRIRLGRYAIAINPVWYRRQDGDSLIRASAASTRVGWDHVFELFVTPAQKKKADLGYTRLLQSSTDEHGSEIERNSEFLDLLTGTNVPPTIAAPVETTGDRHDVLGGRSYCLLFPGASWFGRRWPAENFAEIGSRIRAEFGWDIVLCGSQDERQICNVIEERIGEGVHNLAGQTTLLELVELVRQAKILVSNETSAVHIAPIVDTPSVCITGGGHYGYFVPYPDSVGGRKPLVAAKRMDCYNCNWNCTQPREEGGPTPCVKDISVNDVMLQVRVALGLDSINTPDNSHKATELGASSPTRKNDEDIAAKRGRILYWLQDDPNIPKNFGDYYSVILNRILEAPKAQAAVYRLVGSCISPGMIAEDIRPFESEGSAAKIAFWGCGARDGTVIPDWCVDRSLFFSVRGPKTRDILNLPADTVQGDTALLLPVVYTPRSPADGSRKESICIIHYNDPRSEEEIRSETNVDRVLRAAISGDDASFFQMVDIIANAEFVLCGALHAAIAACAYAVPFAYYDSGFVDIPFKWIDFSESIGIPCEFVKNKSEGVALYHQEIEHAYRPLPLFPILDSCPFWVKWEYMVRALVHDGCLDEGEAQSMLTAPQYQNRSHQDKAAIVREIWNEKGRENVRKKYASPELRHDLTVTSG